MPAFSLAPAPRTAVGRTQSRPALRPAAEAASDIPRHSAGAYRASPRIAAVLAGAGQ
jgi:hypothetical protein